MLPMLNKYIHLEKKKEPFCSFMKIWLLCHFLSFYASQVVKSLTRSTKVSKFLFICSTLLNKDEATLWMVPNSVSHRSCYWNPPAVAALSTALAGSLADWESSSPSPRSSSSAPPLCLSPPPNSVVPCDQHMDIALRELSTSSNFFKLEWKQSFNCRKRLRNSITLLPFTNTASDLTWSSVDVS